jgi:hypothetical protein
MKDNYKNQIITKKNHKKTIQYLNQFDTAVFFGKGETFYDRPRKDNELYLCGNNAINHLSECDILIMNDIIATKLIDPESYSKVDYIMIPFRPHNDDGYPEPNLTYFDFIKQTQNYFNGDYIIINLPTCQIKPKEIFNLNVGWSVINTGVDFIGLYTKIRKVETYGFAVSGKYCDDVANSGKLFSDGVYEDSWIFGIREVFNKQIEYYHLDGNIN